jgi:hypothetical protein
MFVEDLEQQHIDTAESIIQRITPDASTAIDLITNFRALVQDKQQGEEGFVSLLDSVSEACDWEATYYVDWKDTDSFVDCVSTIARHWGCQLAFSERRPEQSVPDLIRIAHAELEASELGLWGWDTQGDNYSGWIGRLSDASFFKQASDVLEVRIIAIGADF